MLRIPVNRWKALLTKASVACCISAFAFSAQAAEPLTPGTPIVLPGTQGGFDFIRIDTAGNRLLLAHEKNKTFDVFDLKSKKLVKSVPTGTCQDAAVDLKHDRYYVSGNDPSRFVSVNRKTLAVVAQLPMSADSDLVAYNPNTGRFYQSNDTAAEVWVIDPDAKKIVTTIKYQGGGVEDLVFDPDYKHMYQAIKGSNMIAEVDAATNQVLHQWPLAPDTGPHGIALVPEGNGLLVACAGKLVLMDRTTGKILDRADIAQRVDEMAYDPGKKLAYCAGRFGKLSVVRVEGDKLTSLGDVSDEQMATSVTVDPKTHTVWIAYGKGDQAFLQPFTPAE
jgi:DNA-binding beta-propeller fold protein YncE